MTPDERKRADAICLRLLEWELNQWCEPVGKWEAYPPHRNVAVFYSPSQDPSCVVPLAEALRGRGFGVRMATAEGMWNVGIYRDGALVCQAQEFTLHACLALAAARAMGEEP